MAIPVVLIQFFKLSFLGDQSSLPGGSELECQGQELSLHVVPLRQRRRVVQLPSQRRKIQQHHDILLLGGDRECSGLSPQFIHRLQRLEARESAAGQVSKMSDHRLMFLTDFNKIWRLQSGNYLKYWEILVSTSAMNHLF